MRRILSHELLPIGSPVQVGMKRGTVATANIVQASNSRGGTVALHEITFTHRMRRVSPGKHKLKPLARVKTEGVNYAGILALE